MDKDKIILVLLIIILIGLIYIYWVNWPEIVEMYKNLNQPTFSCEYLYG